MIPYVVRQGDYLPRLAHAMGFSAEEVWNDPSNRELRAVRQDMNILAPGDVIQVPEPRQEALPLSPGAPNRYRASVPKTSVNVVFLDGPAALADEPCRIEGLGPSRALGRTDGEGRLTLEVPLHVREVSVIFPGKNRSYSLLIGHMDPVTETSGVRARLEHLGYLPAPAGEGSMSEEEARARLREAVRVFQRDQGLEPSGQVDGATRDALRRAHGA
jgi:hypothetical protein